VRQRLGYEQINIYGTSYGTWAAFVYLRLFPDRVRTLILKGVVPPTMELSVTTAFDSERAMKTLIADCAADAECAKAFPNLSQEYRDLLNKLRKAPIAIRVSDTQSAAFTRAAFALTLRALLHAPASSTQIPLMIHQAAEGNLMPFLQTYTKLRDAYRQEFSLGMFLTIYCSEEIPRIDVANLPKDLDSTFHGDTWLSQFLRICPDWPKGEISADFHKPIQSDKPVLLISGGLDPVTPERWAAEAAKTLPNSLNVVVPKAGHSFNLMKGCVDQIITKFVQNGSGKGINTSCANKIQRPAFSVNE
jgi:pimeloyl-ACP methyl ester carboxylesterase